jgi:AcrR family transcriptional regulator
VVDSELLDSRIEEAITRHFLDEGIAATELKAVAKELGISRSTLYRHFPSGKADIAFRVAGKIIEQFLNSTKIPEGMTFSDGFSAVSWQLRSLLETELDNRAEVTFLREFDVFFNSVEQAVKLGEPTNYENHIKGDYYNRFLQKSLEWGYADGSIRSNYEIEKLLRVLTQGCLAIAVRIVPRYEVYQYEYGESREITERFLDLMLAGIKNNRNRSPV